MSRKEQPYSKQGTKQAPAVDKDGVAVVNAAGCAINKGLMIPFTTSGFKLSCYTTRTLGAQFAKKLAYENSTNSDTYYGFTAGKLRCVAYDLDPTFINDAYYCKVDVDLEICPDVDWRATELLNAGLMQKVSGKLVRCQDNTGQAATTELPLSVSGVQLGAGPTPNYLEFRFYNTAAFANIF